MRKYSEFRPTPFDPRGICLDDQQDWLVTCVSQTRDSGCLDQSNFAVMLRELGGESETVEIHRFGHWGPGWFEIIIIDPKDEERVRIAQELEDALSDYPIADESDFSEREWNKASEWWMICGMDERIRICAKYRTSIFAARRDEIPERVDISYLAE